MLLLELRTNLLKSYLADCFGSATKHLQSQGNMHFTFASIMIWFMNLFLLILVHWISVKFTYFVKSWKNLWVTLNTNLTRYTITQVLTTLNKRMQLFLWVVLWLLLWKNRQKKLGIFLVRTTRNLFLTEMQLWELAHISAIFFIVFKAYNMR